MIYGYARTSTTDQKAGLLSQLAELNAVLAREPGEREVYSEEASAVGDRPVLARLLAGLGKGDVLVVTKLDRLARSVVHMGELLDAIHAAGATLRILNLGLDTSTPTGKLMLNVMASVAQFEREMMLERQAEGIAAAKAAGKYTGRKPRHVGEEVRGQVARLIDDGYERAGAIFAVAESRGLSERQVRRIVNGK